MELITPIHYKSIVEIADPIRKVPFCVILRILVDGLL